MAVGDTAFQAADVVVGIARKLHMIYVRKTGNMLAAGKRCEHHALIERMDDIGFLMIERLHGNRDVIFFGKRRHHIAQKQPELAYAVAIGYVVGQTPGAAGAERHHLQPPLLTTAKAGLDKITHLLPFVIRADDLHRAR